METPPAYHPVDAPPRLAALRNGHDQAATEAPLPDMFAAAPACPSSHQPRGVAQAAGQNERNDASAYKPLFTQYREEPYEDPPERLSAFAEAEAKVSRLRDATVDLERLALLRSIGRGEAEIVRFFAAKAEMQAEGDWLPDHADWLPGKGEERPDSSLEANGGTVFHFQACRRSFWRLIFLKGRIFSLLDRIGDLLEKAEADDAAARALACDVFQSKWCAARVVKGCATRNRAKRKRRRRRWGRCSGRPKRPSAVWCL